MLKSAQDLLKLVSQSKKRTLYVFNLDKLDVFRQLTFEEFLYRNISPFVSNSAFFLVNNHQTDEAVIFGLSGNPVEFIKDFDFCKKNNIKLVKRFSGGGTVLIDENALTSSLIATHTFAPGLKANEICKWTFDNIYMPCKLFKNNFSLIDGDYVMKQDSLSDTNQNINLKQNDKDKNKEAEEDNLEDKKKNKDNNRFMYYKVGGNAQAYSKYSFVHHTSFIWNVSPLIEKILNVPKKAPKYRDNRDHSNFLESVSKVLENPSMDKDSFANSLRNSVASNINKHNQTQLDLNYTHFHFKYFTNSNDLDVSNTLESNTFNGYLHLIDHSFIDSCIDSLEKSNTTYLSY